MSKFIDWMADDITWCSRECSNTDCFRNLKNRKTKGGMISIGDMYEKEKCPTDANYLKERNDSH